MSTIQLMAFLFPACLPLNFLGKYVNISLTLPPSLEMVQPLYRVVVTILYVCLYVFGFHDASTRCIDDAFASGDSYPVIHTYTHKLAFKRTSACFVCVFFLSNYEYKN